VADAEPSGVARWVSVEGRGEGSGVEETTGGERLAEASDRRLDSCLPVFGFGLAEVPLSLSVFPTSPHNGIAQRQYGIAPAHAHGEGEG